MTTPPTSDPASPRATASARALVALLAVLLAVPALVQAGVELARGARPYALSLLGTAPSAPALRDFEDGLEQRSLLRRLVEGRYPRWIDAWLRRGNLRVVFGRSRWLFYRDAVRYVAAPPLASARARRVLGLEAAAGSPLDAIVDFKRQLAARGIELVLVPVPVKATLYPERLVRGAAPDGAPVNPGLEPFLADLEAAGVRLVDVTPALLDAKRAGTGVYLLRDTHWTPAAMRIAAREVAARLRALPPLAGLPRAAFDHRAIRFEGRGDLYDMFSYASTGALFPPMEVVVQQVVATRDGRRPTDGEGSPVLLLGDSLTSVFSDPRLAMGRGGGFAEHLADALGMPIDVIAQPGGGATRVRRVLARDGARLDGKRVVVWQLTQRDLLFARDGWQRVALPPPSARPSRPPAAAAIETVAIVDRRTELPETLDYADCMIVLRYRQVDGALPGAGSHFHVAFWGVRGWRPAPAAAYREGDLHRLSLVPATRHHDLGNTCWLDTTGLEGGTLWWAESVEAQAP